ncbi:GNAT family N-acetyltransferase [Halomicrococcus sp. NG-SE-24]|uniref:GNAT family N-acetyltransferase n=1 Tax=Halomicrococcus sp. NG-SE-24 TaxID=3436928 RepID=UPI003D95A3FE
MIRDARPDDLPRLRRVRKWLPEPTPQLLEYAVGGPPLVLVSTAAGDASAAEVPVGYVLVVPGDEAAYVAELAVEPAHRREGRARRLLATAFDRLRDRDCSRVTLAVRPDAGPARALYDSLGFVERDREADYYADGADAILLARDL